MTAEHFQQLALRETLRLWFPAHEPRRSDPAYRLFDQAKRKMHQLDLPCWRCGVRYADLNAKPGGPSTERNPLGACQLEAHHADIEFSLQNAVDVEKWWEASHRDDAEFMVQSFSRVDGWLARHSEFAAYTHDEIFRAYMESEGNLMQLCDVCHRSRAQGIHHIPMPEWRVLAVWRRELPPHVQAA